MAFRSKANCRDRRRSALGLDSLRSRRASQGARSCPRWIHRNPPLARLVQIHGSVLQRGEILRLHVPALRANPKMRNTPLRMTQPAWLIDVQFGLGAGEMLIEVGQALDFGDVGIVFAIPVFGAGPFAVPV